MKQLKRLSVFLCITLISMLWLGLTVQADESIDQAIFLGNACVLAPADTATIHYELVSYASTIEKALQRNQSKADEISMMVQDYGHLTCDGYRTNEGFSGTRLFVTRSFSLTTRRVEDLDAICQILIDTGVASIYEITCSREDLSDYFDQAMRLAIDDAKRKAESLGVDLPLVEIQDLGSYAWGEVDSSNGLPMVRVECSLRLCYRHPQESGHP